MSPFGCGGKRSKCSASVAFSLYGTPLFRKYPSRKFVVLTLSEPPSNIVALRGGAPRRPAPPPPGGRPASRDSETRASATAFRPGRSHSAFETPCHVFSPAGAAAE